MISERSKSKIKEVKNPWKVMKNDEHENTANDEWEDIRHYYAVWPSPHDKGPKNCQYRSFRQCVDNELDRTSNFQESLWMIV